MESPRSKKLSILERIVNHEKKAFGECLDTYGNLIWQLTKAHTDSQIEAEQSTREIFAEIWKYSSRFDASSVCEKDFVAFVTFHYLFKKFGINNSALQLTRQQVNYKQTTLNPTLSD